VAIPADDGVEDPPVFARVDVGGCDGRNGVADFSGLVDESAVGSETNEKSLVAVAKIYK